MTSPQWTAGEADAGVRLDKFLADAQRLGSRAKAATAIDRGKVYVNEAETDDAARRLEAGDVVRVWMDKPGTGKRPLRPGVRGDLDIVYEDDVMIVVNKPAGLLAVPLERKPDVPSALQQVEAHLRPSGKRRPLAVHRIDQDTSGLVVFAKDARAQEALKAQFKRREPDRVYWAIVYGEPSPLEGTWQDRIVWDEKALIQKATHPKDPRGTDAVSEYRVLETFGEASLIEVELTTGRRNQIRLQARLRGHPLVGEDRYTYGPDSLRSIPFGRQALHARRLALRHPADGRRLTFEVDPPADMSDLLARLRRSRPRRA